MHGRPSPGPWLYWAVFLLHVAVIWALPFVPTQDGPTHVYNTLVARDLIHGGSTYGAFFTLRPMLAPNLGAVAPLYALMAVLPPLAAEKVFLTVALGLIVSVMPRLIRMVGGERFPGAFLTFPLLFSAVVLYGFYSLLVGQALCLWALWFYWQMRRRDPRQQWLAVAGSALALFLCHLLAAAVYLLAVAAANLLPSPSAPPLVVRARRALAQLAVPGVLLALYAWSLATVTPSVPYASPVASPGLLDGLNGSLNLMATVFLLSLGQPALALNQLWTGLAAGVVLCWLLLRPVTRLSCAWPAPGSGQDVDAIAARRWLLTVAGVLTLGMLVVPDAVGELALIKVRFPSFACLLIVPLAGCVTPRPGLRRVLLAVCLAAAAVNAWYVVRFARQMETLVRAAPLPPDAVRGRFVAGYLGEPLEGFAKVLLHAPSYYCGLHACVDLGNYQALLGHFFVSFRPDPTLAVSRRLDFPEPEIQWERYPRIAFVRGWRLDGEERARMGGAFRLLGEDGPVTVWGRPAGGTARDRRGR